MLRTCSIGWPKFLLYLYLCASLIIARNEDEDEFIEKVVDRIPVFTTQQQNKLVNEGSLIRLPCFVDRLEGFVLLWKLGDTILTVGDRIINTQDTRTSIITERNGNWLLIDRARVGDSGEYTCHISAFHPKEIVHNVLVRTRPVLKAVETEVDVVEGANTTLECYIKSGQPTPFVTWKRVDGQPVGLAVPARGVGSPYEGLKLVLVNVTWESRAQYRCQGDNGFVGPGGMDGFGSGEEGAVISLSVGHKPYIQPTDFFKQLIPGRGMRLTCIIHAHPLPEVKWFRGETALSSHEYNITEERETVYKLHLSPDQIKIGNYSCHAHNRFGNASKLITISNQVGPIKFTSDVLTNSSSEYLLTWTAQSATEVLKFLVVVYQGSDLILEQEVIPSSHSGTSWKGRVELTGLSAGQLYRAHVAGVNQKLSATVTGPFSKPDFIFGTVGVTAWQVSAAQAEANIRAFGHNGGRAVASPLLAETSSGQSVQLPPKFGGFMVAQHWTIIVMLASLFVLL